jgi:hypothetical protein
VVVIANYVFDSIPQDAFHSLGGQLFETLITIAARGEEVDPGDPEMLGRLAIVCDYQPARADYYDVPEWNVILRNYTQRLPDTDFLFPTSALRCIRKFNLVSGGRMLVLSGDRGYSGDEALLEGQGAPAIAVHGSVSMEVDYQIIGEDCRLQGGQVLHPAHPVDSLNISAFMFGDLPGGFIETRQAYAEAVEKFGPDDFFTLKHGLEQVSETLTFEQWLAFLRLSCWDYKRFLECLPLLKKQLPEISDTQKAELYQAILRVWNSYLPIGEENDLAFELGTVLLEIGLFAGALEFLQYSIDLYGMEPGTAYNMGVCCYSLAKMEKALEYIDQALQLDADFDAAKALRLTIESTISGQCGIGA